MSTLQFSEGYDHQIGSFTCGLVQGSWLEFSEDYMRRKGWSTHAAICVNTIHNEQKGNGDFDSFMCELERSCAARNCDVMFLDVSNLLAQHLTQKRGFEKAVSSTHYVKRLSAHSPLHGL